MRAASLEGPWVRIPILTFPCQDWNPDPQLPGDDAMPFVVSDDCRRLGLRAGAVLFRNVRVTEAGPALRAELAQPVVPGEFGYVDAQGRVLCRLDVVQAEFSKVTAATGNALLIVEGTVSHAPELLRQAVAAAVRLVTGHCGGTAEVVAEP